MLSIRNLSKTYSDGVCALNDVTLEIPKGIFGLLGANGAGKSTLMRTIATLQEPDGGSIRLGNVDVLSNPDSLRQRLGYLPQDFGVYPRATAWGMLDHLARLKGVTDRVMRAAVIEELLRQTNLLSVADRKLGGYSGGMRQRFGIAQALIGSPELLIVDEPTAGLDPEERNRFHNLLSETGDDMVTILSTHIVDDIAKLCTSIAILDRGTIVASGPIDALLASFEGRIWTRTVEREEVVALQSAHTVISVRLLAGQRHVHVLSDKDPGSSSEAAIPELEHAHLATLAEHRGRLPQAAKAAA